MKSIKNEYTDLLMRALLKLENIDECYALFEDLCTISEMKAMSQRIEVAKMLKEKYIYSDIAAKTGASTATISRVNRSLQYGEGGYDLILKRLSEEDA